MYDPPVFRIEENSELVAFVRAFPLGLVVAPSAQNASAGLLSADLIPLLIDDDGRTLRGHFARVNPLAKSLATSLAAPQEILAVFIGPNAYVSPSHYPSKKEHGRVVPTWNYAMVQARGMARLREEDAWLARQLEDLTAQQEAGRESPWAPGDAPADYIAAQIPAIVGLEIEISDLRGKYKISQNRDAADRQGVLRGLALEASNHAQELARFMNRDMSGREAPRKID